MTRSVMFMVPRTYKLAKTVLKERLGKSFSSSKHDYMNVPPPCFVREWYLVFLTSD